MKGARFDLGRTVWTAGIDAYIDGGGDSDSNMRRWKKVNRCIKAHARGDWGDLSDFDKKQNEDSLDADNPARILSKYWLDTDTPIYINTEWDRSVTTVMLCQEY